jgi:hypothetical protein
MFELHQTLVRNVEPVFKLTPQKYENISIEANILKIDIILFCLKLGRKISSMKPNRLRSLVVNQEELLTQMLK